jgi:hypothetical protein
LGTNPDAPATIAPEMIELSVIEDTIITGVCCAWRLRRMRPSNPLTSGKFRSSKMIEGCEPSPKYSKAFSRQSAVLIEEKLAIERNVSSSASQNKGWSSTTSAQPLETFGFSGVGSDV